MIIKNHKQLVEAIRTLVDYSWSDEERDYEENKRECGNSHIFITLKALDKWIGAEETT